MAQSETQPPGTVARGALDFLQEWPDVSALGCVVAVAIILAWHTWARWGSIEIDCGKSLYVPIEILRGRLLYRDIWYPYGPLTPYLLAGLVGVFGRHLNVLYCFGIALAIGCSMLLYRIGATLEGRAVGLVGALALLFRAFGSTQFNYPYPYTYAAPLGLLLSLLCAWLTVDYLLNSASWKLTLAAVAAGLALVCKPEFGVASYFTLAFGICVEAGLQRSWRSLLRKAIQCLPGLVVVLAVYGWFCWKLGPAFVLLENVQAIPGSYCLRTYGARVMAASGLSFIPSQIISLIVTAGGALVAWFWIAKGMRLKGDRISGRALAMLLATVFAATATARCMVQSGGGGYLLAAMMLFFPPGMFFIACGLFAYLLYMGLRDADRHALAEAVFTVLALVLGVRVMVAVMHHYFSIFYAPPLILVFIAVLSRCIRAALKGMAEQRRGKLVNALLAMEAGLLAIIFVPGASHRTVPFRTSWGTIYLTSNDATVSRQILDLMVQQRKAGNRVAVLPELTTMYALADTEAPSRWFMPIPGVSSPSHEGQYIAELAKASPAYIIISNEDSAFFGAPYFGLDYDRKIYRWIERHYRVTGQLGDFRREYRAPLAALIYKRMPRSPSAKESSAFDN